jgi:hypothetical protein
VSPEDCIHVDGGRIRIDAMTVMAMAMASSMAIMAIILLANQV